LFRRIALQTPPGEESLHGLVLTLPINSPAATTAAELTAHLGYDGGIALQAFGEHAASSAHLSS
jgi:hypothetical protein